MARPAPRRRNGREGSPSPRDGLRRQGRDRPLLLIPGAHQAPTPRSASVEVERPWWLGAHFACVPGSCSWFRSRLITEDRYAAYFLRPAPGVKSAGAVSNGGRHLRVRPGMRGQKEISSASWNAPSMPWRSKSGPTISLGYVIRGDLHSDGLTPLRVPTLPVAHDPARSSGRARSKERRPTKWNAP